MFTNYHNHKNYRNGKYDATRFTINLCNPVSLTGFMKKLIRCSMAHLKYNLSKPWMQISESHLKL